MQATFSQEAGLTPAVSAHAEAAELCAAEAGLARIQHDPAEVRCRCLVCGAHAYSLPGVAMSGHCGNCHSFDLEPIEAPRPSRHRITSGEGWALAMPPREASTAKAVTAA